MKAGIIAIGDEILIGQVIDTNSTFISKQLYGIGVETDQSISIHDTPKQIVNTLNYLFSELDLVVITGGLGPTNDDLTKATLVEYFNDKLIFKEEIYEHIKQLFERMNRKMSPSNKEQAMLPENALLLHNKNGTAPGMIFQKNGKIAISLPGVPFEMKELIIDEVLPFIKHKYNTGFLVHKTVLTYGLPESELADKIKDWEFNLPKDMGLAYLPSPGRVRLRISLKGKNESELYNRINHQISELKNILGELIFGYNDESIENVIAKILLDKKLTICTAESFTGGKLANMLTSIPGSSAYYKGTLVSYATSVKTKILGIDKATIKEHTVVSKEVAVQMAEKARLMFDTDLAISTTGVAGPNKGEDGKEPGTAIIAISSRKNTIVEEFNFGQPRDKMQGRAVAMCFDILRKKIDSILG